MDRLTHPVYRHRLLQIVADAALLALAYYLAFRLRFLENEGGVPDVYRAHAVDVDRLRRSRQADRSSPRSASTRSGGATSGCPDFAGLVRASAVSTLILLVVLYLFRPFDEAIPRSVLVTDFLLTTFMVGGARLLVRMLVERPEPQGLGGQGAGRRSSSEPARAARWSSASSSSTRTWSTRRSASSTTTRASAACGCTA